MIPFLTHLVRYGHTFLLAMALWRASPQPRAPAPQPGAGRGTAGRFCSYCSQSANVRKWNLTQFMKWSSLSLAALCCHKLWKLWEGCEQQSCRAGGGAYGRETQQGRLPRGTKICRRRKITTGEVQALRQGKPATGSESQVTLKQLRSFSHVGIYSCYVHMGHLMLDVMCKQSNALAWSCVATWEGRAYRSQGACRLLAARIKLQVTTVTVSKVFNT